MAGAPVDVDLDTVALLVERGDLARDDPEAVLRPSHCVGQQVLKIAAVVRTRREIGAAESATVAGQPVYEMIGLVGQRTHVAGADIQEMASTSRRIGDAQCRVSAALDQDNAEPTLADEMGGQQNAAGAATDDRDVGGELGGWPHHAASMEAHRL